MKRMAEDLDVMSGVEDVSNSFALKCWERRTDLKHDRNGMTG